MAEIKKISQDEIKALSVKTGFSFSIIAKDNHVDEFVRLIAHYKDPFDQEGHVFIDLNQRGKLILNPEKHKIPNFYDIDFTVNTLNIKEMLAEKVCALINRNRPRDYFDVYYLIKRKILIDVKLVKKKMKQEKQEYNIDKIFNKTNKIYNNWQKDLSELTLDKTPFTKIIKTIKEHFKYNNS